MKRFLRILLNALTVLSLLICLATVVLWVREGEYNEMLVGPASTRITRWLVANRSGIEYLALPENFNKETIEANAHAPHWWQDLTYGKQYVGDRQGTGFIFNSKFLINIGVPYWFICLITALAPAIRLTARLRRKRHPPGLCPKCGYDLRATPDRCPECGSIPAKGAS